MRRYDIDWLRVLVLGLLIIYHSTISFMPFGIKLFFPQNKQTLDILWFVMGLINIWRIPLLFIISGMAVCFSMKRRNWKELWCHICLVFLLFAQLVYCFNQSFIILKYRTYQILDTFGFLIIFGCISVV